MDIPPEAKRRIAEDKVVWLTTVTDKGVPAPNPVWFVADGDDLVVFTAPGSRKVRNIEQRPAVTLHFNSAPDGSDIVIINGEAEMVHGQPPSKFAGFLDKYEGDMAGWELTVEGVDQTYNTQVRIRPSRVRLTPTE